MFRTTCALPSSRGTQRQRSILAMMIWSSRSWRLPLSASTVCCVSLPVAFRPLSFWYCATASARGLCEQLVVDRVAAHGSESQLLAQRGHALVGHQERLLGALVGDKLEHRSACD